MSEIDLDCRSRLPLRLSEFHYLEAETIEEACLLLSRYKSKAKVIAAGTDLLVLMKNRVVRPQYIINIKAIADLDYIHYNEKDLRIGALTTLDEIANSPLIRQKLPALADTVCQIATPQVRNVATIGGNLCNAAPSADTAPLLIVLGAKVEIKSLQREKTIALEEFLTGPRQSILQDDEILIEIQIPNLSPHTRSTYQKLPARTTIDIAAVGVAAAVTLDLTGTTIVDAKIALGAVAPTPIRAYNAERIIKGKAIEDELIVMSAQAAAEEANPISDIRASADYRREMVKVLTNQAIRQAITLCK